MWLKSNMLLVACMYAFLYYLLVLCALTKNKGEEILEVQNSFDQFPNLVNHPWLLRSLYNPYTCNCWMYYFIAIFGVLRGDTSKSWNSRHSLLQQNMLCILMKISFISCDCILILFINLTFLHPFCHGIQSIHPSPTGRQHHWTVWLSSCYSVQVFCHHGHHSRCHHLCLGNLAP